ncbi:hypothetical protein ACFL0L_05415 [Patescibacteria group bacterium]
MEEQGQQQPLEKSGEHIYKKWWFWLGSMFILVGILTITSGRYFFDESKFSISYIIHHQGTFRCKCEVKCERWYPIGMESALINDATWMDTGGKVGDERGDLFLYDIIDEVDTVHSSIVKEVYFGIPTKTIENTCPDGYEQGSEVKRGEYYSK